MPQESAAGTGRSQGGADLVPDLLRLAKACGRAEDLLQEQGHKALCRACPEFAHQQQHQLEILQHSSAAQPMARAGSGSDQLTQDLEGLWQGASASPRISSCSTGPAGQESGGSAFKMEVEQGTTAPAAAHDLYMYDSSRCSGLALEHDAESHQRTVHVPVVRPRAQRQQFCVNTELLQGVPDALGIRATKMLLQVSPMLTAHELGCGLTALKFILCTHLCFNCKGKAILAALDHALLQQKLDSEQNLKAASSMHATGGASI